jgi:capsular polysaccharide export protein
LARQLRQSGAKTWRVGFNAGDRAFWRNLDSYIAFAGAPETWPGAIAEIINEHGVTDLVLYGDTRPIHAQAIEVARDRGVTIHVFEEGYLRPYWVTYERNGANGHSALMQIDIPTMKARLAQRSYHKPVPPGHWGDMREHVFYGALYHWFVLFRNQRYPNFRPHRSLNVAQEFRLYLKRFAFMPLHAIERMLATLRIRMSAAPYHVALLQLEHDSSFQAHGPFDRQSAFLEVVIEGFAKGAPQHHRLVIKAHPLEDGRAPLKDDIRRLADAHGVSQRVSFVRGGKLAGLLKEARSAVTVTSTAGQQVLWRGLPLRAFGRAVYCKDELVSKQPLPEFFACPTLPDNEAYRVFRDFLLATSQLPGSFYARKGRRQVLRRVADMMLSEADPYQVTATESAAVRQQLRVIA